MKGFLEGSLVARILEKAIMKIEGEMLMNAETSNPSIINYRICGWIPE